MVELIRDTRKGYLKQAFFDQFRHSQPNIRQVGLSALRRQRKNGQIPKNLDRLLPCSEEGSYFFFAKRCLKRSTRPAVSTRRCLPV